MSGYTAVADTDTEGGGPEGVESAASYQTHEFSPSALPAPPHLQPSAVRVEMLAPALEADGHGRLEVHNRPGWLMRMFMCPFPFCGIGCCLSESSDLTFDDRAQMMTITKWAGYCVCCKKPPATISYHDIANVVAVPSNVTINNRTAYNLTLVLKTGERFRISDPDTQANHAPRLLSYHRFLFGRANPAAYRPPDVETLFLF